MAEDVPAITLTDPQNRDTAATSPIKHNDDAPAIEVDSRATSRPVTPTANSSRPLSTSSNRKLSPSASSKRSPSNDRRSPNRVPSSQPTRRDGGTNTVNQLSLDPLSQHIMARANVPTSLAPNGRPTSANSNSHTHRSSTEASRNDATADAQHSRTFPTGDVTNSAHRDLRSGVKAVTFLSRLVGSTRRKQADEEAIDSDSLSGDDRPEGTTATVFSQPQDNFGFSPRHAPPPAYIKVRARNKSKREFNRLFLAQELDCRTRPKLARQASGNKLRRKNTAPPEANTIWAMGFSRDGKYLAAAGNDAVVRVWAVLASPEDRQKHEQQEAAENEENGRGIHAEHLSAPVFQSQPFREYEGHTATVLDLSWSKNNFLLTSSMDKTVRLWHVSRAECLCTFKHNDFVPSISFHPKDDRFFLAGSLDSKLRLWSIPDKNVAYAAQVPDMITAVGFSPDGKYAIAGGFTGVCMFFETDGLKYQSQMHVRLGRGNNAKGSKITGIQTAYSANGDVKLLITSNDSRIRLYNLRDKSLEIKLRAHENNYSQIRASLSECARYVVCGSEDRKAYIWSMDATEGAKSEKRPVEIFEAHNAVTTAVCLAPAKTRYHLSKSEDPIYDLCNPPPVVLMSRAERSETQSLANDDGSAQPTPISAEAKFTAPQPSPAYVARSSHKDGNIIVTADFTGQIKVFRQDCAWSKRRSDDDRSSLFGKRSSRLSRTGSLATKPSLRSLRDSPSLANQTTSVLANGGRHSSSKHSQQRTSSPQSLELRSKPQAAGTNLPSAQSPPSASNQNVTGTPADLTKLYVDVPSSRQASAPEPENPLAIYGGASYTYWDTERWAQYAQQVHKNGSTHPLTPVRSREDDDNGGGGGGGGGGGSGVEQDATGHLLAVRPPPMVPGGELSYISMLSDERSELTSSEGEFYDDAKERHS